MSTAVRPACAPTAGGPAASGRGPFMPTSAAAATASAQVISRAVRFADELPSSWLARRTAYYGVISVASLVTK